MASSPRRWYVALAVAGVAVGAGLLGYALLRRGEGPPSPAPVTRGQAVYEAHCAVCHGRTGKGDGPGARVIRQPIQDFSDPTAMGKVSDQFLSEIIKKGGSQFGRSNAMPSWDMQLSDEEIRAVVGYIRSLASQGSVRPGEKQQTP